MPLTDFQREVLAVLVANRSEASHFDIFHEADVEVARASDTDVRSIFTRSSSAFVEVARASDTDVAALREAGYEVEFRSKVWDKPTSIRKASVSGEGGTVEIDWAADSAVRFFPIEEDPLLGWRLHLFDMATNKALALSARTVTRDYVDIVELDAHYPLEAVCWAACGKDPGFSPLFLLMMMKRFARIDPIKLEEIQARKIDPIDLKRRWIAMGDRAEAAMERVANQQPDLPIGLAFLDREGVPRWVESAPDLVPHPPTLRGCLPTFAEEE